MSRLWIIGIVFFVPALSLGAAPNPNVAAVPTLGEAGFLGLAVLLPLAGAWGLKRRLRRR